MFSPLDTPEAQEWFRRFDLALRRLPAEECTRQREEMQQHLEGIVTAHKALGHSHEAAWKAALTQFGDPTQIGRKIAHEWQQGCTGVRADIAAILFGIGLHLLWIVATMSLVMLYPPSHHYPDYAKLLLTFILSYNVSILIGAIICAIIGRKYPFQAIKGAFYALLFWRFIFLCRMLPLMLNPHIVLNGNHHAAVSVNIALWIESGLIAIPITCAVAYLASVTKRGWYRPTLADFTLTLLPIRRQISR